MQSGPEIFLLPGAGVDTNADIKKVKYEVKRFKSLYLAGFKVLLLKCEGDFCGVLNFYIILCMQKRFSIHTRVFKWVCFL